MEMKVKYITEKLISVTWILRLSWWWCFKLRSSGLLWWCVVLW